MSHEYDGFETFVSTAPSPTSPYGRFIAGATADDGDKDDAAHLMALAMASTDCNQWLGWRVGYLNVVEGSSGNAALTAGITNYNGWIWHGAHDFAFTPTMLVPYGFFLNTPGLVANGHTLHIGDPLGTFGAGQILVHGMSSGIEALGGADIGVDGTGGRLYVTGGADLPVDIASTVTIVGTLYFRGGNMVRRPESAAPVTTGSLNCETADTFVIGNTAADVTTTLQNGPGTDAFDVTFYSFSHDHNYGLKVAGGTGPFVIFGASANPPALVNLRWTGVRWILINQIGDGASITMDYTKFL